MSNAMTTTTSSRGCGCGSSSSRMRSYAGTPARSGGCGCGGSCGGSGCSCAASCSCGGGGCGLCQGQDLVRPRFFAGQLLTEEDLDLLVGYVVEKNRLHNRSLFGAGVVCGLMVTCDPCGGGKVTVEPGHALDCCGNDIVVPCAQTLDINLMVKQLRIELNGGVDCGDPCTDAKAKAMTPTVTTPTSDPTAVRGGDIVKPPTKPPPAPAEFCLYLRYCETPSDPVSPYASDDPCGAQACEPTRIREGFRFELRCKSCDVPGPDNLFSRILACFGNLTTAERSAKDARSLSLYRAKLAPALERWQAATPATAAFDAERLRAVDDAKMRVASLPDANSTDWSAEHIWDATEAASTFASTISAWNDLDAAARRSLPNREQADAAVKAATGGLARIKERVPQEKINVLLDHPLDAEIAGATLKRALLWTIPQEAIKIVPRSERELLDDGVVYDRALHVSVTSALSRLKANLLERLLTRGSFTDCALLGEIEAVLLPSADAQSAPGGAEAQVVSTATKRLSDLLIRYIRQCICDALNPPCEPCDDPAVLLACVRVEGCNVVDICNLERDWVLTTTAIRYWMPFLHSIGEALEAMCCPHSRCNTKEETRANDRTSATSFQPLMARQPRSFLENRSLSPIAERWTAPGALLDPSRFLALLPESLRFNADNARRAASAGAAAADLSALERGRMLRDLVVPTVPGIAIATGPAAVPAATPAAPAAPPSASVIDEVLKTDVARTAIATAANDAVDKKLADVNIADLAAMQAELADLKKKLAAAERRVKKLEGHT